MDSFLMIGQSNMAGRGFESDVEPINAENLYVMRSGIWEKFYVPVNPDEPQAAISLAESFAESYVRDHKCEVGLIPCAKGPLCNGKKMKTCLIMRFLPQSLL